MRSLTSLKPGESGVISGLQGDERFTGRVNSIGLTIGCKIEMLQNEKKQPVLIYARDTMVAINRSEAEKIEVEEERQ